MHPDPQAGNVTIDRARGERRREAHARMIQNINIARVSLITHGSLSALRTLDGVYIPRDRGVLGTVRDIARERKREEVKERRRDAGRQCVFVLLRLEDRFLCGPLWRIHGLPRKTHVFAAAAAAAGGRGIYGGKPPLALSLPLSFSLLSSFSSVPLCSDITRQKYCDWSTIEYDVTWIPMFGGPEYNDNGDLGSDVSFAKPGGF